MLGVLMIGLVAAPMADALAQRSIFPSRARITKGNMKFFGKGRITPKLIMLVKRSAIPFRPLTLQRINDRRRKAGARGRTKALKLSDTIKIPRAGARGKSDNLTVEEYTKIFNAQQKMAAAAGFNLEDENEKRESAVKSDSKALQRQKNKYKKDLKPIKPMSTERKFAYLKLKRKGAKGSRGKGGSWRLLRNVNSFRQSKGSRGARGKTWEKIKGKIKYSKEFKKDFGPYGDKKVAAVGIESRLKVYADLNKVELTARGGAYLWIFDSKKTVIEANANFLGERKGWKTSGAMTLKVLGIEKPVKILSWGKKKGSRGKALWEKAGEKPLAQKKYGHTYSFVIGFVPVSVKVGASFAAGIRWRVELHKMKISAEVGPYLDSDAFAEFAIDIKIMKAGVGAEATLLDAELMIGGEVGVTNDKQDDIYVYAQFAGDLGLKALDGRLYLFIDIWNIFKWDYSRLADLTIFKWKGLEKRFRLFELNTPRWYIHLGKKKASQVGDLADGPSPMKGAPKDPSGTAREGYWGTWGGIRSCPSGSYAYGYRVMISPYKKGKDRTAMTALQLKCRDLKGKDRGSIKMAKEYISRNAKWSNWATCKKGHFLNSYTIRMDKRYGGKGDDSSAHNVRFRCSDNREIRTNKRGFAGSWQNGQSCGKDAHIDGFNARTELWLSDSKGSWYGTAPFCKGRTSDCTKRGRYVAKWSKRGNGKKCWTGKKVLCKPDNTAFNGLKIGCAYRPGEGKKSSGGGSKPNKPKKPKNSLIKVAHSGKCVDVKGYSKKKRAKIHQWKCHGKNNQRWTMDKKGRLISKNSGKCLDIKGGSKKKGARVHQWNCHNGKNQQWYFTAKGELKSKLNGKCLDVKSHSKKNGGVFHMWNCHGGKNQKFSVH